MTTDGEASISVPRRAALVVPGFDAICAALAQAPRMHGYYLTRLIAAERHPGVDDETHLDQLFEQLDDKPWPPSSERPHDSSASYEVDEATAAAHAATLLIGGADVGHLRDTLSPATATALWSQFRALFASAARYYIGLGLGDPAFVHQRGVAIIDDLRAGYLGVVESD